VSNHLTCRIPETPWRLELFHILVFFIDLDYVRSRRDPSLPPHSSAWPVLPPSWSSPSIPRQWALILTSPCSRIDHGLAFFLSSLFSFRCVILRFTEAYDEKGECDRWFCFCLFIRTNCFRRLLFSGETPRRSPSLSSQYRWIDRATLWTVSKQ
jgi:hypothetical protein